MAAGTSGTFGCLMNVPGDNDCFYHVIASGLMVRLAAILNLTKSPFWDVFGVQPGLLRWGVAAYLRAMMGRGPLSYHVSTWLGLNCPGQSFALPSERLAVLERVIAECEGERSWMGRDHGEYTVLAGILRVIIRVFSSIGCQPGVAMLKGPSDLEPAHVSFSDAFVDVVGEDGHRRYVLRPGQDLVRLKPSCIHVPLHCVAQASREALDSQSPPEVGATLSQHKEPVQKRQPWAPH